MNLHNIYKDFFLNFYLETTRPTQNKNIQYVHTSLTLAKGHD